MITQTTTNGPEKETAAAAKARRNAEYLAKLDKSFKELETGKVFVTTIEAAESNRNLIHYINEFIVVTMFSKKILEKRGTHWNDVSSEQLDFFKLLLYNLRYRNFTAQSLELAFAGFCCGES
jgi:hypothetical protein